MKNKYHLILPISLGLISLTLAVKYFNEIHSSTKLNNEVDNLHYVNDSLSYKVFELETDLTRHEITRDEIFYNKPKLKKEYEDYYERNTE